MLEVKRGLALFVERVHGDDAEFAVLANEDGCGCPIDGMRRVNDRREALSRVVLIIDGRRIEPATAGSVKEPAAIVIRSPAPGLEAGESPAESRIVNPLARGERRPAEAGTEGPPSVTVAATGRPSAVSVEIGEAWNVIARARVLHRGVVRGGDRINAAGDPMVEVIGGGKGSHADGFVAGFHGERLAFAERSSFFFVKDGDVAGEGLHVAAIVKVVDAEGAFAAALDGEIATGHAEIVAGREIDVEGSGALTENEACGARAVLERKIEKFENGVFVQESHGAIFKFDFGAAAAVRGDYIALADGQVRLRRFPYGLLIGEGVAVGVAREAHIALDDAEANNAGVTGVGSGGLRLETSQKSQKRNRKDGPESGLGSHESPPSVTLRGCYTLGRAAIGTGCANPRFKQCSRRVQAPSSVELEETWGIATAGANCREKDLR